jgi:hypothetical protein
MEYMVSMVDEGELLFHREPKTTKMIYEFHCVDGDGNEMYATQIFI